MSEYTPGFERWWKNYPSWRRKDKIKCFLLWQKRHLEERADALVEKLKADVSYDPAWQKDGQGKQFIPLSHTYLNGGRYDDDPPKPARAMPPGAEQVDDPRYAGLSLSWSERMMNRLGISYMRRAKSLPEVDTALRIKRDILKNEAPVLQEDIDLAGDDKDKRRQALGEAAITLAELFLSRLDQAYHLNLCASIMRSTRR